MLHCSTLSKNWSTTTDTFYTAGEQNFSGAATKLPRLFQCSQKITKDSMTKFKESLSFPCIGQTPLCPWAQI